MVESGPFKYFAEFVKARQETCEENAADYSGDLTKLLVREQELGAGRNLKLLVEEFTSHVELKLNQAKEKENVHS